MTKKFGKGRRKASLSRSTAEPTPAYGFELGKTGRRIIAIRGGFDYREMHSVQLEYDLPDKDFARLIGVSGKTLFRIKRSAAKLSSLSADRVYRLEKTLALAAKVLGNRGGALSWLRRPQQGLGGAVPLELLDTEPGYEQVQLLLNRLELGVMP